MQYLISAQPRFRLRPTDDQLAEQLHNAIEKSFTAHLDSSVHPDQILKSVFMRFYQKSPRSFIRLVMPYLAFSADWRLRIPFGMAVPMPQIWKHRPGWIRRGKLLSWPEIAVSFGNDQWIQVASVFLCEADMNQAYEVKEWYGEMECRLLPAY